MLVAQNNGRDLLLTTADFELVRKLIHARAGISLAEHKTEMVYSRLAKRLRVLNQTRFADYLALLQRDAAHPEWEHFTNALTTNLTAFFREAHHFPVLANHVRAKRGAVKVWTAAASTGEEAWSIAITLADLQAERGGEFSVLATDIDTRAIATARAGVYPLEDVKKLDADRLQRSFLRGVGSREGLVRVNPQLQQRVEFKPLNLLDSQWDVGGPFDAIFCRNLLIYFDKETQRRVLERFARLLRSDGLLFAGHSENLSGVTRDFSLRSHTVYELTRAASRQTLEKSA